MSVFSFQSSLINFDQQCVAWTSKERLVTEIASSVEKKKNGLSVMTSSTFGLHIE